MSDSKPGKGSSKAESPKTEEPVEELTSAELESVVGGVLPAVHDLGRFKSDYTPQKK